MCLKGSLEGNPFISNTVILPDKEIESGFLFVDFVRRCHISNFYFVFIVHILKSPHLCT